LERRAESARPDLYFRQLRHLSLSLFALR